MPDRNPFALDENNPERHADAHHFGPKSNHICITEVRGRLTPNGHALTEIVVDASEGFVPLWAENSILRWQFNEASLRTFRNPEAARAGIRQLFADAVLAWGDAAPIRFTENSDASDFEIYVRNAPDCDATGCVLASAFFPDQGRHRLNIYPTMFQQSHAEQVETLAHEIGHIFGLRHFFALLREAGSPALVYGTHDPISIMNYGAQSQLTDADRRDLKELYQRVWLGELTNIEGTPIRQVHPFSSLRS